MQNKMKVPSTTPTVLSMKLIKTVKIEFGVLSIDSDKKRNYNHLFPFVSV